MRKLTYYLGKKRADADNGIDGLGVSDVDSKALDNPLCSILHNNMISKTGPVTYERTNNAEYIDRYGNHVWAKNAENTNYCQWSNDFSQWADVYGNFTYNGTTTDPFSGSDASLITIDGDTNATTEGVCALTPSPALTLNELYTVSVWVKVVSGTIDSLDISIDTASGTPYTIGAPTLEWVRYNFVLPAIGAANLWLNPRGLDGAQIAVYGFQVEKSLAPTENIETIGSIQNSTYDYSIARESKNGWLTEGEKTNLIKNSNDLSLWTLSDCTIERYLGDDIFNVQNQMLKIVYGSLADISLTSDTDALTEGVEYSLSFYAWLSAGSMKGLSVNVGGGDIVVMDTPPVSGFTRMIVKCIAGPDNGVSVFVNSPSLSAVLLLSYFQLEVGEASSVILTSAETKTRAADTIEIDYDYQAPKPDTPWGFTFRQSGVLNNSDVKTVFSNGESGVNEFSLSFVDDNLVLNMGGNESSYSMLDVEKPTITYDGSDVKFYSGRNLLDTQASASTSFIATKMYFGYNGTNEHLNAYLADCLFFNSELSANNIAYLAGA